MYQHVSIHNERSVHKLRYLSVLLLSVSRHMSDHCLPNHGMSSGYVQCRDML
jgi:hypothetical protein